jgi:hypothetical protein
MTAEALCFFPGTTRTRLTNANRCNRDALYFDVRSPCAPPDRIGGTPRLEAIEWKWALTRKLAVILHADVALHA